MLKNLGYTIISVQIPDHVLAAVQNMDEIEIYVLFFCLLLYFLHEMSFLTIFIKEFVFNMVKYTLKCGTFQYSI